MGVDKFLWVVVMVIIGVSVIALTGVFTFSLVQAASWADSDKHDLAQPDDRGKR